MILFILNTNTNNLQTLLSSLGVSVELRGTASNIIVIMMVHIKTIGPILWRVRRDSRHKINDDDQSPTKIKAPIPIAGNDILPKKYIYISPN